jgi:hypothetical protein
MLNMELGKHNVSDRDAVVKEITNLSGSTDGTKGIDPKNGKISPIIAIAASVTVVLLVLYKKSSYTRGNKASNKLQTRKQSMGTNKELQLEILLAIILLIGISLMPVAVGANWEEIAKNSALKIAILGDSTEIKESLIKSANASNIYTSADLDSDIFEQVNIIFINSSYLKNLQGTEGKEAAISRLDSLAHSGKTMIAIGSNPEVLYEYVKPNSMFIDLNSGQQMVVALGVMIFLNFCIR